MNKKYAVSLKKIAKGINPDWTLDDWFQWPPDLFALCATIINRTGIYKLCLLEPEWWNNAEWEQKIDKVSNLWVGYTSNLLFNRRNKSYDLVKKELGSYYQILKNDWSSETPVDLDHLRTLSNIYVASPSPEQKAVMDFAKALLFIYVTADFSCGGLGFIGQPLKQENLAHRNFMVVANLLLNNTGSLSTIPKFHGVVVPKMRTPQAGMVARSLTHYITFHTSEVEIIWRTFPWLERRHKSLNILAVPYPLEVGPKDFELVPDSYQAVRYFKGKINPAEKDKDFILALVRTVSKHADGENMIDIVVLPEMALSSGQYEKFLNELKDEFIAKEQCARLPIIISGVVEKNTKKTGYPSVDETFHNAVRMDVYFGGTWFGTTQRKHHRWQLDRSQIKQYELEGHFSADNLWFEYCSVSQRRLTILSPNGWLALTALICEDLARQEPIGEVIRGIGPTLLMALLSDGPQLKERWSARYASVLADDPGTAVLSLTSKGMMQRSKRPDGSDEDKPSTIVGLWKDMIKSWKEMSVIESHNAILFTISADYKAEYTLDGRSDGVMASVFKIDSHLPQQIDVFQSEGFIGPKLSKASGIDDGTGNIRELSAVQFVIDAILDIINLKTAERDKISAINLILHLLEGKYVTDSGHRKFRERLILKNSIAFEDPKKIGLMASAANEFKNQLDKVIQILRDLVDTEIANSYNQTIELYESLIDKSQTALREHKEDFAHDQVYSSLLYNLYNRLSTWHPANKTGFVITGLTVSVAMELKKKILNIIKG